MRNTTAIWLCAAAMAGLAAGCGGTGPGMVQDLGAVEYSAAFEAAKDVMAQYFTVESADPLTGVITSRPRPAQAPPERLLSGSAAREVATLRVMRTDNTVAASASVAVQRLASVERRRSQMPPETYNSVPNQTPADSVAATTAEQNDTWTLEHYNHRAELNLLQDLYRRLHPAESQPAASTQETRNP